MRVKGTIFLVIGCLLTLCLVFLAGIYTGSRSSGVSETQLRAETEALRAELTGIQSNNQQLKSALAEESIERSRLQEIITGAGAAIHTIHRETGAGFQEIRRQFETLSGETLRGAELSGEAEQRLTDLLLKLREEQTTY